MRYAESALIGAVQIAMYSALALGLLGMPAAATAGSSGAKLTVSATILKHASLNVLAQPSSVVVTAADIARGYVDAAAPSQVAIKSNTSGGYLLEFANQGDFMRQILVRGLTTDVQLSPSGGVVMQASAGSGMTRSTLSLGFRFMLAEAAQAGTYSWPMRLSVTPL
jgi:hypothetical protein